MNDSGNKLDTGVDVLIRIFEDVFGRDYRTRLLHSESDPEYIPAADQSSYHQIAFAHGFFSSALHEIAHWCVAGEARRLLPDYGYWYAPDGRDSTQQQAFYRVEIKPQALEWIFTVAAGRDFRVSTDNLSGDIADDVQFERDVLAQVHDFLGCGLPARPLAWARALASTFDTGNRFLDVSQYTLPERYS